MKGRWKAVILILIGVSAVAAFLCLLPPREPSYQGKPLSQWINGMVGGTFSYPTDEQRTALRAMGEPAVTQLIILLQKRDSLLKRTFIAYCQNHQWLYDRYILLGRVVSDAKYHNEAAVALGEIGPPARAAVPALIIASNSTNSALAVRARAALMKIREEPVTALLPVIANTSSTNWQQAAETARLLGTNGEAAVPLLIAALQSTNTSIRRVAELALGGIASRPDLAIPALKEHVRDKGGDALLALGNFTNAKPQAVPILLAALQDTNAVNWVAAAMGLDRLLDLEEKRTLFIPALTQSLTNADAGIQLNARIFLQRNDPAAARAGIK